MYTLFKLRIVIKSAWFISRIIRPTYLFVISIKLTIYMPLVCNNSTLLGTIQFGNQIQFITRIENISMPVENKL